MKFYEVKQRSNNFDIHLAYFREKVEAEKYAALYNTKVVVYPIKIVEHEFKSTEDYDDE